MNEDSTLDADAVIAATRDWLETAVIGLNLCPFAKAVHVRNRVRFHVSLAQTTAELLNDLETELHYLDGVSADECETTLLIHPQVLIDFVEYSLFLPAADARLHKLRLNEEYQLASFHPHYQFSDADADDIENFTNRSPYPTLHLLRETSIDRAVAAFPEASDIYQTNIETLRRLGYTGWQSLWQDGGEGD